MDFDLESSSTSDESKDDREFAYSLLNEENSQWNALLFGDYNVIVSDLDIGTSSELIYEDIAKADAIYNRRGKKLYEVKRELEELAELAVINQRFTSYKYLIVELDVSINSREGIPFVEAVIIWGMSALELPTQRELVEFLNKTNSCEKLISYLVRENEWEMFEYILDKDTRANKNEIECYKEALYVALINCKGYYGSGQILAILMNTENPDIKFKGKTMKELIIRSIKDTTLTEAIDKTCYSIILNNLYYVNKDHRYFFRTVDLFENIVKKEVINMNKVQIKSVVNLFSSICSKLLNRYTELILSYIKKASFYPIFNKVIINVIRREIGEDSEEKERALYLKALKGIALDNADRNPELVINIIKLLKDLDAIAGTLSGSLGKTNTNDYQLLADDIVLAYESMYD